MRDDGREGKLLFVRTVFLGYGWGRDKSETCACTFLIYVCVYTYTYDIDTGFAEKMRSFFVGSLAEIDKNVSSRTTEA